MSKGKGAAKGVVPAVVETVDGAKFATVRIGTTENLNSMLINLNCPVDIMLDNVRRLMAKKIDVSIQTVKDTLQSVEASITESQDGDTPPPPENGELNKLQAIKKIITNMDFPIDLCERSNTTPLCKDSLKKLGCNNVLAHHAVYNVMCIDTEGVSLPCFIDAVPVEEAGGKSPTKKK